MCHNIHLWLACLDHFWWKRFNLLSNSGNHVMVDIDPPSWRSPSWHISSTWTSTTGSSSARFDECLSSVQLSDNWNFSRTTHGTITSSPMSPCSLVIWQWLFHLASSSASGWSCLWQSCRRSSSGLMSRGWRKGRNGLCQSSSLSLQSFSSLLPMLWQNCGKRTWLEISGWGFQNGSSSDVCSYNIFPYQYFVLSFCAIDNSASKEVSNMTIR